MVTFYVSNSPEHKCEIALPADTLRCPFLQDTDEVLQNILTFSCIVRTVCNHGDSCQNKQNKMVEKILTHNSSNKPTCIIY